jgi:hypothetical protein
MAHRIQLIFNISFDIYFKGAPYCLKNTSWSYSEFYFEPEHTKTYYHEKVVRRFIERMYLRYGKD